jgi:hypothetical protein
MSPTKLGFLVALLSISGCVTRYVPPQNTPQATLTLSTNINGVRVQVYDDEKCTKSPYGNRLAYFFMNTGDAHSGTNRKIPANKEFFYTFALTSGAAPYTDTKMCTITLGFTPKPGERYKTHFDLSNGKCAASLLHVINTPTGTQYAPEESTRKITPPCLNNFTD